MFVCVSFSMSLPKARSKSRLHITGVTQWINIRMKRRLGLGHTKPLHFFKSWEKDDKTVFKIYLPKAYRRDQRRERLKKHEGEYGSYPQTLDIIHTKSWLWYLWNGKKNSMKNIQSEIINLVLRWFNRKYLEKKEVEQVKKQRENDGVITWTGKIKRKAD